MMKTKGNLQRMAEMETQATDIRHPFAATEQNMVPQLA